MSKPVQNPPRFDKYSLSAPEHSTQEQANREQTNLSFTRNLFETRGTLSRRVHELFKRRVLIRLIVHVALKTVSPTTKPRIVMQKVGVRTYFAVRFGRFIFPLSTGIGRPISALDIYLVVAMFCRSQPLSLS